MVDFRTDINALRAIAVLAVVLYHFGVPGFSGGFSGVDVFFVVSGYLISSQIIAACSTGSFSFVKFFTARFRRIFPALVVVCATCIAWGWFNELPTDYLRRARHAVAALFFVSNHAFAGESGYFDASALTKPLLHTWSLSVEGQFYLFLPLAIVGAFKIGRQHLTAFAIAALAASFWWCIHNNSASLNTNFYLLTPRAWEFLAGVVLSTMRLKTPSEWLSNLLGLLGLSLLLAFIVFGHKSMVWPGYLTWLPVAGAALTIAARGAPALRWLYESWPVQRMGDISYSLYLWHWPLMIFLRRSGSPLERDLSIGEILTLLLASLICASCSWKFIERPVRSKTGWWTNRRIWLGLGLTEVVFFAAGLAIVGSHGAPVRLPDYVQRASQAIFVNTPRDECFRQGDSTKLAKEKYCTMGAIGAVEHSFVLWGDSHANQYLTAVSDAAAAAGLKGFVATQSGCSAHLLEPSASRTACDNFAEEVRRLILDSPSLRIVVIGKYWGSSDDGSVVRYKRLIQDLTEAGKKVILVGPLPVPGFNVPYEWSAQQIKAGHGIESMDLPIAGQQSVIALNKKLTESLIQYSENNSLVLIDTFQRLCDEQRCRAVNGGVSNFRDESHLSESGAILFTQDFSKAFQKLQQ